MLSWYGHHYPAFEDLQAVAQLHGVHVVFHPDFDCPRVVWHETVMEPWVIAIPEQFGPLARIWALAHEVGHLVLHDGPVDAEVYRMQEDEADAWAACALLPQKRISRYVPSTAGLIRALGKHYQPIPAYEAKDRLRSLAARIALTRMKALEEAG